MAQRRTRMIRPALIAATLLAATAAVGCGGDPDNDEALPTTSAAATSAPATQGDEEGEDVVTPEASQQLCDMIGSEIDTWGDLGPVAARVAFNGTVQNWAARNDGLNDEIIQDTGIVDTVTTQTCPDVRDEALGVLDTDTLASALAGFGE